MALSKPAQSIKIRDFHQFKTEKASSGEASSNEKNKQNKQKSTKSPVDFYML